MSNGNERYRLELDTALAVALKAGGLLQSEFERKGGPRGPLHKCPADEEAELVIKEELATQFPDYGLCGEEIPSKDKSSSDAESHVWVIDPNDGTAAFQKGWRGAAVSIALLRSGAPVLGVVYAYAELAGKGDLIAWAEGQPLTRNGNIMGPPKHISFDERATVFVSQSADNNSGANAELCFPARFRAVPSIAYRLALAAVGEGVVAVSLNGPVDWDVAAGHALLKASGYELYRMGGAPVTYGSDGRGIVGNCVGGEVSIARELSTRSWSKVFERPQNTSALYELEKPSAKMIFSNSAILDRAQGCLLGQLAGDNLGALVEFQSKSTILEQHPDGPREMVDGGHWNILAGQPTDDSELALLLARSIVKKGTYNREAAAEAYAYWFDSNPFDIGFTTTKALGPAQHALQTGASAAEAASKAASEENESSQANGALMRVAPLGIFGHKLEDDALAEMARQDAALTHANKVCQDANAVYCVAIAAAIRSQLDKKEVFQYALNWAKSNSVHPDIFASIVRAQHNNVDDFQSHMGWVLIALQNAFYQLLHAQSIEDGIAQTIACGGDTDTNAAIAGALLGAVLGRNTVPDEWVDRILACRPLKGVKGCKKPRPKPFWPVDCLILAEQLAWLGANADK